MLYILDTFKVQTVHSVQKAEVQFVKIKVSINHNNSSSQFWGG